MIQLEWRPGHIGQWIKIHCYKMKRAFGSKRINAVDKVFQRLLRKAPAVMYACQEKKLRALPGKQSGQRITQPEA
jgi:hypothetical protein